MYKQHFIISHREGMFLGIFPEVSKVQYMFDFKLYTIFPALSENNIISWTLCRTVSLQEAYSGYRHCSNTPAFLRPGCDGVIMPYVLRIHVCPYNDHGVHSAAQTQQKNHLCKVHKGWICCRAVVLVCTAVQLFICILTISSVCVCVLKTPSLPR